jgi:F0F1-type ATP synthase alpha subunit
VDGIPLAEVGRYERELHEHIEMKHQGVYDAIVEKKDLTEDITKRLQEILKAFTTSFTATVAR